MISPQSRRGRREDDRLALSGDADKPKGFPLAENGFMKLNNSSDWFFSNRTLTPACRNAALRRTGTIGEKDLPLRTLRLSGE
jgi:hypothetical protein